MTDQNEFAYFVGQPGWKLEPWIEKPAMSDDEIKATVEKLKESFRKYGPGCWSFDPMAKIADLQGRLDRARMALLGAANGCLTLAEIRKAFDETGPQTYAEVEGMANRKLSYAEAFASAWLSAEEARELSEAPVENRGRFEYMHVNRPRAFPFDPDNPHHVASAAAINSGKSMVDYVANPTMYGVRLTDPAEEDKADDEIDTPVYIGGE